MVKIGPFNFFEKTKIANKLVTNIVGTSVHEQMKGQVQTTESNFTLDKDIGEPHPFNYSLTESVYVNVGLINGIITKLLDFIWGAGFFTKSTDPRAKQIIDDWLRDVSFDFHGRIWTREAFVKGTSHLELGGNEEQVPQGVKVLNSNQMYIKRSKTGKVIQYNQVFDTNRITAKDKTEFTPFRPFEIAQLDFNKLAGAPYGLGLIYPSINTINALLKNEKDMQTVVSRKAGAPIIIKLKNSDSEVQVTEADVAAVGAKLQYLNNKTEWVFGPDVDVDKLDFGDLGQNFATILKHDLDMLVFAFQVPEVLLGRGSIPEGLAGVQMDAFERRIGSIQAEIEKVIEEKIFTRILKANGIQAHVEFEWGQPSNAQVNERITKLTGLLGLPFLSLGLKVAMEKDLANLLGYDENVAETDEQERDREEDEEQPIVPGQNAQSAHAHTHITESADISLNEWLGFNYKTYLENINTVLDKEQFLSLRATTTEMLEAGKLDEFQIENLRKSLRKGFKNGESMLQISERIREEVRPGDAYATKDGQVIRNADGNPRLAVRSMNRPISMARTETVRVANLGTHEYYKETGIEQYSWVATVSDRTCPDCEALNGSIFNINEGALPPLHMMCRCTIVPVIEGLTEKSQ